MWIATQDGLSRFDGKEMRVYNKSEGDKNLLAGNDITDMLEDTSRNLLWVISSYGGLNGIDLVTGNVKYNLSVADSANHFGHPWLKCLTLCKGKLWIGTFNGITIYDPGKGRFEKEILIPFKRNIHRNNNFDINLFYKDAYERVWAFIANYGLAIYAESDHPAISYYDMTTLLLPDENIYRWFNDCQSIGNDQVLVATHQGIKRIIYNQTAAIKIMDENIPGSGNKEIYSLASDRSGNLWFATRSLLIRFNRINGNVDTIKDISQADQEKWLSSINSVFFDNHDNLWLGTLQGFAVANARYSGFQNYFQSPDLKTRINRAFFVYPYNDSVEFVCAEDGFYRVDNSPENITRLKGASPFLFLFRHKDGNLIVSSEYRLFNFQPPEQFTAIEKTYPELSDIKGETINSAVYWGDSLVFIGSESSKGTYEWDYKNHHLKKINSQSYSALKSDIVNTVCIDKMNRIWILSDNSFAVYEPATGKIVNHELKNPAGGQPLNLFFDMCESEDSYWLASYGSGIVQLDKQFQVRKVIAVHAGLANAGVYKLFLIHDSLIYATSNNGLSRINIRNFSVSNYFESDGLHSNAFEESCGTEKDGKIYAGGPNGFSIINTKYLSTNTLAPLVYLNRVTIASPSGLADSSNLFLSSVTVPDDNLQTTVYFSGINYFNPRRTTFAYRIREQHKEWISLGSQNSLPMIGFPPGRYTLEVKAANEDGLWSLPVSLTLIFLPKWYQTLFFRILLILAGMGLLYILYNYRIGQLKRMMRIRTKISQDLHDDVGSSLSGISLMSEIARQQLENDNFKDARQSLDKISSNSGEVLTMMSDIVWAINPKNDTFEKIIARLKSYAKNATSPHGIHLHFNVEKDLQSQNLPMSERKNIYLICKEAIFNATRYAACQNIYFYLERTDRHVYIRIVDDGRGFDSNSVYEGNGLHNMKARALEIKARLEINSEKDKGTSILIKLRTT